jgi:hypothetical protein
VEGFHENMELMSKFVLKGGDRCLNDINPSVWIRSMRNNRNDELFKYVLFILGIW